MTVYKHNQQISNLVYRVPGNIETAAFTAAVNATWEDEDLVTLLNAVTTVDIETNAAVRMVGVLEIANSAAAPHTAKTADGDTPDNDDTVVEYAVAAAIGSEFYDVCFVTDASGNIKIETDDVTEVTFIFHLTSYEYAQPIATA